MRLSLALLLWLVTCALALADVRDVRGQQVQRALTSADRALTEGKHALAQKQLRAAVRRFPGESVLLVRYAATLLPLASPTLHGPQARRDAAELRVQVERARATSGAAISTQDPESERLLGLYAALAWAVGGDYERALAEVVQAGRLQDASTALCLRQIAAVALRDEQLLRAEQALAMARQYVPQDRALSAELGQVLLARGKVDAAVSVLAERLAIDAGDLTARADLAYAMAAQGRAGEALAVLLQARAACEVERGCALLAARVALEAGRPQEASALIARHASQGDLDALYLSADAQARAGLFSQARASYEAVLRQRPDSVRAKLGLEQLPAPSPANTPGP